MIIQFNKGEGDKPSVLRCIREDGSQSWTKIGPAIEFHDLAHYVVETELGFGDAFYGLVARGHNIEDFELPREERPGELLPANLPVEALQTEHMVNLLQVSQEAAEDFDFLETLADILKENDLPFPESLDQRSLKSIQWRLKGLLLSWNKLEPGSVLELRFKVAPE